MAEQTKVTIETDSLLIQRGNLSEIHFGMKNEFSFDRRPIDHDEQIISEGYR